MQNLGKNPASFKSFHLWHYFVDEEDDAHDRVRSLVERVGKSVQLNANSNGMMILREDLDPRPKQKPHPITPGTREGTRPLASHLPVSTWCLDSLARACTLFLAEKGKKYKIEAIDSAEAMRQAQQKFISGELEEMILSQPEASWPADPRPHAGKRCGKWGRGSQGSSGYNWHAVAPAARARRSSSRHLRTPLPFPLIGV